jgi:hypothetical protein
VRVCPRESLSCAIKTNLKLGSRVSRPCGVRRHSRFRENIELSTRHLDMCLHHFRALVGIQRERDLGGSAGGQKPCVESATC